MSGSVQEKAEKMKQLSIWTTADNQLILNLTVMKTISGKMQNAAFLLCAVTALFSVSCSRTKPEISFGFIQLVQYEAETRPLERFSFFIIAEDEDGLENLEELYLYNDREQLRWLVKSDDWITIINDGVTWIGTRSIALLNNESLPLGQYRAVLVNKGGEKSERYFSFDSQVRYPFPSLAISEDRYTVNSDWPNNRLVGYDGEGNYVSTVEIWELNGLVSELRFPSNVRTAALWAEDPDRFSSAFTNVVSVR